MEELTSRTKKIVRGCNVPRDGTLRYLYDIWQPLAILLAAIGFTAAFYATLSPNALRDPDVLFFCNADGNVEMTKLGYSPLWDIRLYFTINIAFGQFPFSTAKVIDAGWDVVVGRGGQMVVAIVAYQTIRRSLTLTMETCTVTIPTVTALCCQQVQLIPMGWLIHDTFWHLGSAQTPKKQPVHSGTGRIRLCMQVIACSYVLSFSTLVSLMTGYAARLTGYYGYETDQVSQLQPISALSRVGMILPDRDRIGISHLPMYESQKTILPTGTGTASGSEYTITNFLESSRNVEEPYGTLIDYYFTCSGLLEWVLKAPLDSFSNSYDLACSWHECSCSVSGTTVQIGRTAGPNFVPTIFADMKSNITVGGDRWSLAGPPLTIGLEGFDGLGTAAIADMDPEFNFTDANDYWSGRQRYFSRPDDFTFTNRSGGDRTPYAVNTDGIATAMDTILQTGRCVAQDAYSWGFSCLLLLTFCSFTILFALTLILLQTDIYWNSRYDRNHQHYTIYTDVLYIAEALKHALGHDVEAHIQSPKAFSKRVERRKKGLRLDVDELPMSRWRERRSLLSLATATSGSGPGDPDETMYELRALKPKVHDRALEVPTAGYGDLAAVAGDASRSEVRKDFRRNSAAED